MYCRVQYAHGFLTIPKWRALEIEPNCTLKHRLQISCTTSSPRYRVMGTPMGFERGSHCYQTGLLQCPPRCLPQTRPLVERGTDRMCFPTVSMDASKKQNRARTSDDNKRNSKTVVFFNFFFCKCVHVI